MHLSRSRSSSGSSALVGLGLALSLIPTTAHAQPQPVIAPPTGYLPYCSKTRLLPSGWYFEWTGSDPCAAGLSGGTIRQAGLWNPNGVNRVYANCSNGARWWLAAHGDQALIQIKALAQGHPGCVFNVSPKELPIFVGPYQSTMDGSQGVTPPWDGSQMLMPRGLDLAFKTSFLWEHLAGVPNSGSTDHLCHDRHGTSVHSQNPWQDHNAYDWVVPTATGHHKTW